LQVGDQFNKEIKDNREADFESDIVGQVCEEELN